MATNVRSSRAISSPRPASLPQLAAVIQPTADLQDQSRISHALGEHLLKSGQWEAALLQFEQALKTDPSAIESWYHHAETLACLNRYAEALTSNQQALILTEFKDIRIWVQRAAILIFMAHPEAALECCNLALFLEPDHAQAWLFRGVALHRLGRYQQAYRSYSRVTHPVSLSWQDTFRRFCDEFDGHP
ncbi:MAG: tetratricopeptide repeat protein [Cyanobacteria bacterium]|nr:tetratricopeptide repeat protein [Cyanobacteriota bacterium]MDA0867315.1 tetratricopeptide repeat protein [Cyanobacteriota bacterium]